MVEANLNINLPEKVDKKTGQMLENLSEGLASLMKLPEKTLDLIKSGGTTLFCVPAAYLKGKAEIIKAKSFAEANYIRRERSQCLLAVNVAENLAEKENNGEDLPPNIEDTDNLFSIQNAASETTDEDFIKFWARLYTEEACKPNTVSKKAINLCRDLDKNVVKMLEEDVFPYCDNQGYFLGNKIKRLEGLRIAKEYGFIQTADITSRPLFLDVMVIHKISQYTIHVFPGYVFSTDALSGRILTNTALEIRKCIGFRGNIDLNELIQGLEYYAKYWEVDEKFTNLIKYPQEIKQKFFISENDIIVYPEEFKGKHSAYIENEIIGKIIYEKGAEKYFFPKYMKFKEQK